jgi:hypothetical protein
MSTLDEKYEKANTLASINTLTTVERITKKFEHLFDGPLGNWNTSPLSFKLKEGDKFFQTAPLLIPKIHEPTLRKKVQHLCDLVVLKAQVASEYQYLSFIIPKKNGTIRIVSDFRVLNSKL